MAFVLKQSETYSWPVSVEFPADGGKTASAKFTVEFKRLPHSRVEELVEAGKSASMTDREVCLEVVCGWDGVTDGEEPVPFSDAALGQMLELTGAIRGILAAWFESLAGAQRKN